MWQHHSVLTLQLFCSFHYIWKQIFKSLLYIFIFKVIEYKILGLCNASFWKLFLNFRVLKLQWCINRYTCILFERLEDLLKDFWLFSQKTGRLYKVWLLISPWIPASFIFSRSWESVVEEKTLSYTFCHLSANFIFSCSYSGLVTVSRMSLKPRFRNSQMIVVMICNLPKEDTYLRFLYLAALNSSL